MNNIQYICRDCSEKTRQFWQDTYSHLDLTNLYVKVAIPVEGTESTENIWCGVVADNKETLEVILGNDPVDLDMNLGDVITVPRTWIITHISEDHPHEKFVSEQTAVTSQHHEN